MAASNWVDSDNSTDLLRKLASNTYEIASAGGGGGTWGSITGTLSAQTDLQAALDLKANLAGAAFTGACSVTLTSLGLTATPGFTLRNTTAAAAGAQQVSPGLVLEGQGWKTDATAASQAVTYRMHVLPVQGAAAPSATWVLGSSINGGAYTDLLSVTSTGSFSFSGSLVVAAGNSITWAGRGGVTFPANGVLQFFTNGFGANVDLVATTSARLQLGQDAAGVTNQMLTAANRITSDGVGANLTIAPGNGRGGAGGSLILSTYTTAGAATAGTLTPRLYVNGPNGLLQFGGQTNSFSALKGNGDQIQCRLADDSDWAPFLALNYTANGSAGVSAGPFTTIDSITVVGGIVTDLQGS
jgi:hypothetical protein